TCGRAKNKQIVTFNKKQPLLTFTPEQEAIFAFVRDGQGHGIIDAVAGAGKTTTIMECARFAAAPSQVLFCAFNASIAREIGARFRERGMPEVAVKTIHALGYQILRDNGDPSRRLDLKEYKYRTLYRSEEVQKALQPHLHDLIRLHGYHPGAKDGEGRQNFAVRNLLFRTERRLLDINQKHRSLLNGPTPEAFAELVSHYGIFTHPEESSRTFPAELELYRKMHRLLLKAGTELAARSQIIDFTDMLYLPFVWKLNATKRYDWIFIDECQDLSKAQFAVAAKYGKEGSRVLAVGDPRQSIYGFTGADVESFARVKRMTRATQLQLTTCFRCPTQVIELAKEIRTDIVGAKTNPGIVANIDLEEVPKLACPGDLIISRFRAPLLLLVFEFIDAGTKVRVHPDEATEFLNELKVLFKQSEREAPIKARYGDFGTLRQQVHGRNLWVIRQEAAKIPKAAERELYLKTESDYLDKRLDFLEKKYERWQKACKTVGQMLKRILDFVSAKEDAIRLSTIHRAKGLEEKRVFVLDYDQLPFGRQGQKDWERAQEVNLKYVAITRAQEALFLVKSTELTELEEEASLFDNLPFDL
ncbi:MAG: ATP-dependent helicase, partial [Bacteroidota bacterium]